ncbi:hypothetical protein JYT11_00840 [Planctomycetaceae bacterium AH-315-I19]|nr:hypothetical protein [Planctomycetaceae bacterium AH-315-I19]
MKKTILALYFAMVLCGCSQHVGKDVWEYQPYIGPGHTAEGTATIKATLMGLSGTLTWKSTQDPKISVSAKRVVDRSRRFLQRHGYDTVSIDHGYRKRAMAAYRARRRHVEDFNWNGLEYYEATEIARGNPLSRHGNETHGTAFVIVSVKPTIIVIAPGLIRAGNLSAADGKIGATSARLTEKYYSDVVPTDSVERDLLVGLPGGLVYDNRVPRVGQLLWCSPDLNVSPTPILFDDDGTATINLPWGQLVLTSSGSVYKVSAHPAMRIVE